MKQAKTLALLYRSRRLDGCVEREQIGLERDFIDNANILGDSYH